MCDVLLPPGVNPTVVKYIYYIISYIISWSFHNDSARCSVQLSTEVTYSFYSWRFQVSLLGKNSPIALYEKKSQGGLDLIFGCKGRNKSKNVYVGSKEHWGKWEQKFREVIKRKYGFTRSWSEILQDCIFHLIFGSWWSVVRRGGETVSLLKKMVSEVTLFLFVTYLLRPFMSGD
jgi:hypothetical protein